MSATVQVLPTQGYALGFCQVKHLRPHSPGDPVAQPVMDPARVPLEFDRCLLPAAELAEERRVGMLDHNAIVSRMPRYHNDEIASRLPRREDRDQTGYVTAMVSRKRQPMPILADDSPEATALAAKQAERLRRLRRAVARSQAEAARAACVSADAWNRMETNRHRLNALALARFGEAYNVAVEYVISGRLAGLPEGVARVVAALEAQDETAAPPPGKSPAGNPGPQGEPPRGTYPERSTHGRAKRPVGAQ